MADMNILWAPQVALAVKNPPANTGDAGLILWFGKIPWGGNGNPLQYSCLEKSVDSGADGLWSIGSRSIRHLASLIAQLVKNLPAKKKKRICLQCWRPEFNFWVGKIPWRRKWQPTPVLLPGEVHGQRSLVGYSPWGLMYWGMTEWLWELFVGTWKTVKAGREVLWTDLICLKIELQKQLLCHQFSPGILSTKVDWLLL